MAHIATVMKIFEPINNKNVCDLFDIPVVCI